MPGEYRKFRGDLIISPLEGHQETAFVVKDPVTKKFFRIKQHEFYIARQLDGDTSFEEIQKRFEREFGVSLPADKLKRYIQLLENLSFLEGGRSVRELSRSQSRTLSADNPSQRVLYIKLRTLDPNRVFDRIMPHIGFFFTRKFVWLVIVLSAIALYITISNWSEYTAQAKSLIAAGTIPTLLLVIFTVTALHEVAHGLTCKHFGGDVHGIGFLLIYLLPAFYCDVSDAWLFKEKSKKMWVSFAGMFFQVFLWALATVVWRVVDTETWLSEASCLMMAASGISTLFNFNPLLKLDGYYLIADHLEIPNLRRRAFAYMTSLIRRWFGASDENKRLTAREKRIYLLYGLLAGAYSAGLLIFIFWKIARFVFANFRGSGLILLITMCVIIFTGALERCVLKLYNAVKEGEGFEMKRKRTLITIATLTAIILIAIFGKWELKISNKSELLPGSQAVIRAQVAGTIMQILVDEGDAVTAHQVIARLDDTEYRAELMQVNAEITKWQAELELLTTGPLEEEIERLQQLVDKARMRASFAEKEFERINELYTKQMVARIEYEKASEELSMRRKEIEQAESDLDVLTAGYRPEKMSVARSEIKRLEVSREFLGEKIARTEITSPIDGVVATRHLKDKLNEYMEVGDELCMIVNYRTVLLEMPVSEKDVSHLQVGQRVKFRARSMPQIAFHGKVTAIALVAASNSDRKVFVLTSEVDNPDLTLHPGMTGNAKVYCGKKRFIYLWTRKVIRFIRVEFWW